MIWAMKTSVRIVALLVEEEDPRAVVAEELCECVAVIKVDEAGVGRGYGLW